MGNKLTCINVLKTDGLIKQIVSFVISKRIEKMRILIRV